MIKYVELTAPEASAFRQAKILSIECQEGDQIKEGDTLFRVQSGAHEINLPSTKAGRIVELIATEKESITLSTALLLLETEVVGSTASAPIIQDDVRPVETRAKKAAPTNKKYSVSNKAEPAESKKPLAAKKPLADKKPAASESKKSAPTNTKKSKRRLKKAEVKQHEQQSLDLLGEGDLFEEPLDEHEAEEVVLTQTVSTPNKPSTNTPQSQSMPSSSSIQVTVPDIGTDAAKVIEILVAVGDRVNVEDPLVTLESDKASMDVPSPNAGIIKSIAVAVDQDVSEGTVILELESEAAGEKAQQPQKAPPSKATAPASASPKKSAEPTLGQASETIEVKIPDIGGDSAKVIEILVNVGDTVEVEDSLVTLESDKASMDVPSSAAGKIESIAVKIDQEVSEGVVVVTLLGQALKQDTASSTPAKSLAAAEKAPAVETKQTTPAQTAPASQAVKAVGSASHASPSIRRFARELGVDLSNVVGSGRKGRVTHDDVKQFVKGALSKPTSAAMPASGGAAIPEVPAQDFSKFGEIELQPLNRIKQLTATNLHRSWLNVPHVTHHDESNISDLESFRKQLNEEYKRADKGIKLSPLAFIVKAVVNALRQYPQFNSSLEPGGQNLIMKKYFHIGIAVETPNGLVVPVIRDADKKSVAEIAKEMAELASKARDKKLTMQDMSGASFTISSLGGIGGTSFTPIVNAPEVAILGVSRSKVQPVWNGKEFEPGPILPLSLSYDHRVIDGAEGARFTRHIADVLEDVRRLTV